jgi:hypothetical protein
MRGMWHVWGRKEVYIGCWWGSLRERSYLEHLGLDGRIIFKWFSKKWDGSLDWMAQDSDR